MTKHLTCDICNEASADVMQSGALYMCEKCEREIGDEYYEGYPGTEEEVIDDNIDKRTAGNC